MRPRRTPFLFGLTKLGAHDKSTTKPKSPRPPRGFVRLSVSVTALRRNCIHAVQRLALPGCARLAPPPWRAAPQSAGSETPFWARTHRERRYYRQSGRSTRPLSEIGKLLDRFCYARHQPADKFPEERVSCALTELPVTDSHPAREPPFPLG